jgi:transcription termination/antitermination protein NusA
MERTISFKERRYIEELRILTKSTAIDCIIDERFDRIIYVVRPGDMGLAIGKKGDNIRRMQSVLGKKVEMVEYADTPQAFLANIFKPAEMVEVKTDGETGKLNAVVRKKADVGIAIGKGGCTIEKARLLLRRFYDLEVGDVFPEVPEA